MDNGRTHRERKELYIKALEDEVLRLKEVFSNVTQDKDKLAEENRQLKMLLSQNGLSPLSASGLIDDIASNQSLGYNTSSPSVSGGSASYAPGSATTAYTPPMTSQSNAPSVSISQMMPMQQHQHQHQQRFQSQPQHTRNVSQQQQQQHRVDYEQAGIDFVLTYENPKHPSNVYIPSPPR